MVSLLGLRRGGEPAELPREITRTILPTSGGGRGSGLGETGWLMRFFDSAFFCEWIAVSYLYKHDHPGVRDYLCNRMYTLPLSGIESYLFQICYMLVYKPSPSLDKFVIDICSKSLQISLKVHWFLMAEIEDSDESCDYSISNEQRISGIQKECQIAATLMGEWPPLIRPSSRNDSFSPLGKNQVFNKLFSSKPKLMSPPPSTLAAHRSCSLAPLSAGNTLLQDGKVPTTPEENKIFKKLIPSPRVRDALLFRKSVEKDEEGSEKDGFFKRLLRDSKEEDSRKSGDRDDEEHEKDGFFKRLLSSSNKDDDSRKEDEEADKDGFFKKLLSISRDEDGGKAVDKDDDESEKDGFFKRLLKDSRHEDEEVTPSSDGVFKRLFRDNNSRNDSGDKPVSKSTEDDGRDGIFRKFFKEKVEERKDGSDGNDNVEKTMKLPEDDEKEGFFKKFFKEKVEEKKDGSDGKDDVEKVKKLFEDDEKEGFFKKFFKEKVEEKNRSDGNDDAEKAKKLSEDDEKEGFFKKFFKEKVEEKKDGSEGNGDLENAMKLSEDDEKEGFFKKFFKEKFEDKKDGSERANGDGKFQANNEEDDPLEFSLFRRLFRVHPDDPETAGANENAKDSYSFDSSPGTEKFFRKLFRDRDRSVEDSELFGSRENNEKRPGSPKQQNEKSNAKPPLPNSSASQFRKGTYFASLEFVHSLCETSYELVDVFPIEDRKSALCESLAEINAHVAAALSSGGVCFPMGKGMYRVVNIPEDEAILLNSREKAPYMICVEVLKSETPSNPKDASNMHKLSKGGIPLANGDALLPKPPPWAYPLWTGQDMYFSGNDRMSISASQAIDQAMAQLWEAKVKFVHANLSVEKQSHSDNKICSSQCPSSNCDQCRGLAACASESEDGCNGEWVRVVLTADPGVSMDDIVDQELSRRKEHRRVPSTVAIEEVKAAALKGEAPTGVPLKGSGQDSSGAQRKVGNGGVPKATDALSGELWEVKKERIRKASVCGKLPGWDLQSVIVKSGDDCRQEHLAVQLISHFYDIFQEAGLPLWLRPYEVLVTSSYTALIETIPDTASIHSIKSRHPNVTSLRDFFVAKYQEDSPHFKLAQRNFVESMAGYSLVCYLLQFKDRHNGNLLLDEEGHIIHIDFGFMLSNSPGGVNFESAPFKLTRELLEVMDSDAEGVPSEFFDYFKVLCIQGFLTCRKHAERIILLVEMVQDSGFPCFNGGPRTIQNLRERFHLSLTEEQCVSLVLSLISSSLDAWRTRQYDYYQRVLNGIL